MVVTARIRTLKRRYRSRTQYKVWAQLVGGRPEVHLKREFATLGHCLEHLDNLDLAGYPVRRCRFALTVAFNMDKLRRKYRDFRSIMYNDLGC